MQPNETQNQTTEPTSNPQVSQAVEPTTNQTSPSTNPVLQPPHSKKKLISIIIAVALIVIISGVAFAYYHANHKNKPTSSSTSTSQSTSTVATNTWTGKDNTYNWNDANNWSLGVPTNNQILEINLANVKQPAGGASFSFQDNISNLIINKLVIDGQTANTAGFSFKGAPLTITNGIEDTATASNAVSYSSEIQIDNQINISGNVTIKATGHNFLTFYSANSGEEINLGTSTLQFSTSDTSQIAVSGAIVGTGEILLPDNAISSKGSVVFDTSSPNFDGKVVIGSADSVNVGNQDNGGGGHGTVDAFGNSSVKIMSGGAMVVFAVGTSNFNVNNAMTVSGNGITQSNGSVTGAVSACVTPAEEGCGSSENVTFTGPVKLLGNTQIGQSTPSSLGANNVHVSYTFNNLDKNGYILNTVNSYYYSAQF